MNPTTYTVNEAGATSIQDARPMTFGLNRYVTANVYENGTVSVFVGITLHFDGLLPAGVVKGSAEFYTWVRKIATDGESARELPELHAELTSDTSDFVATMANASQLANIPAAGERFRSADGRVCKVMAAADKGNGEGVRVFIKWMSEVDGKSGVEVIPALSFASLYPTKIVEGNLPMNTPKPRYVVDQPTDSNTYSVFDTVSGDWAGTGETTAEAAQGTADEMNAQ